MAYLYNEPTSSEGFLSSAKTYVLVMLVVVVGLVAQVTFLGSVEDFSLKNNQAAPVGGSAISTPASPAWSALSLKQPAGIKMENVDNDDPLVATTTSESETESSQSKMPQAGDKLASNLQATSRTQSKVHQLQASKEAPAVAAKPPVSNPTTSAKTNDKSKNDASKSKEKKNHKDEKRGR